METRPVHDHLAFITADTAKTHDFYVDVMGWPLVGAFGNQNGSPPWIITGYDAGAFTIEFEEQDGVGLPGPSPAPGFPHFGLMARDAEEVATWRAHLDGHGVAYLDQGNELWFADPNGINFQLFVRTEPLPEPAERLALSKKALAAWLAR